MKKTKKLLAGAVAVAIGGLAMTGMASADTQVTHNPDAGITYVLNSGFDTEQEFIAGTITITDGETTITMLDRNLGATEAGIGCYGWDCMTDPTYGYYFQWGNNYGFKGTGTIEIQNGQVSSNLVNPGYTSGVFYAGYMNWIDSDGNVNLRGGNILDSNFDYLFENDTWKVNNATDRRGPCPEGFHVPSYGELAKVVSMVEDEWTSNDDFLVPFAGMLKYDDGSLGYNGSRANFWSSSPLYIDYPVSVSFGIGSDRGVVEGDTRATALPVRCFYDSYETYTPAGNLSSEGGDSEIVVNIGQFNNGQNTCTGQDFIFSGIFASPTKITRNLVKTFQCAFGEMGGKAVTLQLSGDLTDGNGNTISSGNVRLKNSAWVGTPAGVKGNAVSTDSYTSLNNTITLFNKAANIIGIAEGTGVDIQIEIPGGTPDGTYNGTLVLSY